ncbi:MAG: PmoA family protein [Prevotellaceae bacterium]|jgi:hypothetical protein|nr:PmoA family protein [Prevotellaceae bacterium]
MERLRKFAAVLLCAANGIHAFSQIPDYKWDLQCDYITAFKHNGKTVWQFNADPAEASKPHFDILCAAGGNSLVATKPEDHIWHLGHWFSWKYINGVNYWETDKNGIARGETFWSVPERILNADGSARFIIELGYRPRTGENARTLLTEYREIAVSAPDSAGSYTLDWIQRFTATENVTLDRTPVTGEEGGVDWGGYAGLSVRLSSEMKEVKTVTTGSSSIRRRKNGFVDVFDAAGVEQNGVINGEEYGIAVLTHPDSQYGRDWYVIQEKNFTFINPAVLLRSAVKLPGGETLRLRHRVHVHRGRWDAAGLSKAAETYGKQKFPSANQILK